MLGLFGALDPYKHKMNVGMIKIQEDTGVAVISIAEAKPDDLTAGMEVFSASYLSSMQLELVDSTRLNYYRSHCR